MEGGEPEAPRGRWGLFPWPVLWRRCLAPSPDAGSSAPPPPAETSPHEGQHQIEGKLRHESREMSRQHPERGALPSRTRSHPLPLALSLWGPRRPDPRHCLPVGASLLPRPDPQPFFLTARDLFTVHQNGVGAWQGPVHQPRGRHRAGGPGTAAIPLPEHLLVPSPGIRQRRRAPRCRPGSGRLYALPPFGEETG